MSEEFDPNNTFGIPKYENQLENGRQVYGCRGMGETYNEFYKQYRERKINPVWEDDDWPFHYFALNEADEKWLIDNWGHEIFFVEDVKGE